MWGGHVVVTGIDLVIGDGPGDVRPPTVHGHSPSAVGRGGEEQDVAVERLRFVSGE